MNTSYSTEKPGLVTAIAYGAWEHAMRRGNLVFITACSYFTPLLSTLVSCLRLGVVPGARLWVGCGLLVAGSLLSWRSVVHPIHGEAASRGRAA